MPPSQPNRWCPALTSEKQPSGAGLAPLPEELELPVLLVPREEAAVEEVPLEEEDPELELVALDEAEGEAPVAGRPQAVSSTAKPAARLRSDIMRRTLGGKALRIERPLRLNFEAVTEPRVVVRRTGARSLRFERRSDAR